MGSTALYEKHSRRKSVRNLAGAARPVSAAKTHIQPFSGAVALPRSRRPFITRRPVATGNAPPRLRGRSEPMAGPPHAANISTTLAGAFAPKNRFRFRALCSATRALRGNNSRSYTANARSLSQ